MKGTLCHELEVGLPAGQVWGVYGTLRLGQLVVELLPNVIQKLDIVEGDGGVGTVLHLTFPTGKSSPLHDPPRFGSQFPLFWTYCFAVRNKWSTVLQGEVCED